MGKVVAQAIMSLNGYVAKQDNTIGSMRRIARSSSSAGIAIEDIGIVGTERYTMTENDILNSNHDLIGFGESSRVL